jgi:hypothetical protein
MNEKQAYSVKFNSALSSSTGKTSWFQAHPALDVLTEASFSSPHLLQENTGLVSSTSSDSTRPAMPFLFRTCITYHCALITRSKPYYFLPNERNLTKLSPSLLAYSSMVWDKIQINSAPLWKRFRSSSFCFTCNLGKRGQIFRHNLGKIKSRNVWGRRITIY